jgi:hypothetical protein
MQVLITALFSLIAAIVSGLVAAIVVHRLTRSREHEAWIRNCKKEEFRELMSALSASYAMMLNVYGRGDLALLDEDDQKRLHSTKADVARVMQDRIYITEDLPLQEMANSWFIAMRQYERGRDFESFQTKYQGGRDSIIGAAKR